MVPPNVIQPVTIRSARVEDVAGVKTLADQHRFELGFIRTPALSTAQEKGWLLVAVSDEKVIGFANFRIRRDNNATLYDIVVSKPYRRQNIGKRLIQCLTWLVNVAGGEHIRLKCPQSLPCKRVLRETAIYTDRYRNRQKASLKRVALLPQTVAPAV